MRPDVSIFQPCLSPPAPSPVRACVPREQTANQAGCVGVVLCAFATGAGEGKSPPRCRPRSPEHGGCFLDSSPPPPQVFTITDQHWVEYVLRLEQFLLQRKVSSGERPRDPARCDAPTCFNSHAAAAGVFFDVDNTNKISVRSDGRGRRKSLPGCVRRSPSQLLLLLANARRPLRTHSPTYAAASRI
jgi:hypothetical protein